MLDRQITWDPASTSPMGPRMVVESPIEVVTRRKRQFVDVIGWDDIGQFASVHHCEGIRDNHLLSNFGIITPMMNNSFPSRTVVDTPPIPGFVNFWGLKMTEALSGD